MKISFYAHGKVQAVMFRKTFCYGAQKRGLVAGATNDKHDKTRVLCSLSGDRELVEKFMNELTNLSLLNSWGAKVERCEVAPKFYDFSKHEVTSDGIDKKNLSRDIEFFL